MQFTAELLSSNRPKDRRAAYELHRDWLFARARLWSEVVCKFYYLRQLPWCLLGIAHHNRSIGIQSAIRSLALFDDPTSYGRGHNQRRRFCDPTFSNPGDAGDVALRPYVERFIKGENLDTESMQPLTSWLARMACIKVSERSVEGIHSLITRVYKRAPAASLAYVSIEIRLENVYETIARNPSVAWPVPSVTALHLISSNI